MMSAIEKSIKEMVEKLTNVESELDKANPISTEDRQKVANLKKNIDDARKMYNEANLIIENERHNS